MRGGPLVPSAFAPGARSASRPVTQPHSRFAPWPRRPAPGRAPYAVRTQEGPSAQSRHDILQPRRTAAKTFVAKALGGRAADQFHDRSRGRPGRGAERPRSRRQGRCHPPERRRAPQVAPDPQDQRRPRWRARAVRRSRRQDDRQGRRGQGRQGPHRRRQGRQGQGRPDGRRQGPRRAEQDRPRRGRCGQGCGGGVGHDRHGGSGRQAGHDQGDRPKATGTKATATKATATKRPRQRPLRRRPRPRRRRRPRLHRRRPPRRRPRPRRQRPRNSAASRRTDDAPVRPGRFDSRASGPLRQTGGGRPRTLAAQGRAVLA